jgi:hypothetical protein
VLDAKIKTHTPQGSFMSKKSRQQRKFRYLEQKKEQPALLSSAEIGEQTDSTIGDLINRLVMQKMGNVAPSLMPPEPPPVITLLTPQSELPSITVPPEEEALAEKLGLNVPTVAPIVSVRPADWPPCPSSCNTVEWDRAMEHHDHYLLCALDDGNKKPWFQYPKVNYQYSEFVYITPEMAEELLKYNPLNRKIKMPHVDGLRRDILNHRWLQTHESIAVNTLGNMHDGQHRALAIVKAKAGWPIYLTWNVPPEGVYATDSGDKRPINEKLSYLFPDLKMTNKTGALCRSMMGGLTNRGVRYTESEIAAFMFKYKRIVNWTVTNMRSFRSDLQAVIAKSMLWWGEAVIGPFVERLRTVQFCGDGDPAKALYLWLQGAKQQGRRTAYVSPVIYYKKALAAVNAHVAKRDAKRITAKEKDVFEWLPGWDVPVEAPSKGVVFIHSEENKDEAEEA